MRSRIYSCRRYVAAAFAVFLSIAVVARIVTATNIAYYTLTFTYDQSSARQMLAPLNQWRTGGTWYWNSDNKTQTTVAAGSRSTLKWDYNLEQIAMQRAYEIVLLAEHKRPNGDSVFSITVNGVHTSGENIACGTLDSMDTYEKALEAWQENDCDYAGQGHRRNMLEKKYNAVGIAHVIYGDAHYWVQEFGTSVSDNNVDPGVNDSICTVDIPFDMDMMGLLAYVTQAQYGRHYVANMGAKNPCPSVNVFIGKADAMQLTYQTWPFDDKPIEYTGCFLGLKIESGYDVVWSSSNENVVKIVDGSYYQVVGVGNCFITANISYNGLSTSCSIRIEAKPIAISSDGITVTVDHVTYTGSEITPDITVVHNGLLLEQGKDYTYYSTDSINAGWGKIIINGCGSYNGSREVKFPITAKDIDSSDIIVTGITDMPYTGSALRPEFKVYDGERELVSGIDYSYDFSENTNVGTATLTLQGKGNYTSYKFVDFRIYDPAAPTTEASATSEPASETAGPTTEASVTSEASSTTAPVTETSAAPTSEASSTSQAADPSTTPVLALSVDPIADKIYDGTAHEPAVRVSSGNQILTEDEYSVLYSDNVNAGTATVFVSGKGIYSYLNPVTTHFTINARSITKASFAQIPSQDYCGSAIEPDIIIRDGAYDLVYDKDYTLDFEDNTNAGTATVTAHGKGNYSGDLQAAFTINKISPVITIDPISDQLYTGVPVEPEVNVYADSNLLDQVSDYTLSYSNNTDIGQASVTVTLKNNYEGSASANFNIVKRSVNSLTLPVIPDQEYTGDKIEPSFKLMNGNVELAKGVDYSVGYSNNTNPGNAVAIITGIGNYSGTATVGFNIVPKNVASLTVSSISDTMYTGSEIKPSITVKHNGNTLIQGTDYTVEFKNNVAAGKATAVVKGQGKYTGTKTIYFNIVQYSWKKISSKWYYIDNNGTKAKGFVQIEGKYYYFDKSSGAMLTKWQQISGKWYYFNSSGVMLTDWQKISKKWYYFNSDGTMATGLTKISGKYYFFDNGGIMKTGWLQISGKWYYFASGGNAVTGWQKISKKWYYFDKTSAVMATGFTKIDGATYYFDKGGIMKTKWQQISGKWYYFNSDGSMVSNTSKKIGSKVYNFDANGVCLNP